MEGGRNEELQIRRISTRVEDRPSLEVGVDGGVGRSGRSEKRDERASLLNKSSSGALDQQQRRLHSSQGRTVKKHCFQLMAYGRRGPVGRNAIC